MNWGGILVKYSLIRRLAYEYRHMGGMPCKDGGRDLMMNIQAKGFPRLLVLNGGQRAGTVCFQSLQKEPTMLTH